MILVAQATVLALGRAIGPQGQMAARSEGRQAGSEESQAGGCPRPAFEGEPK